MLSPLILFKRRQHDTVILPAVEFPETAFVFEDKPFGKTKKLVNYPRVLLKRYFQNR